MAQNRLSLLTILLVAASATGFKLQNSSQSSGHTLVNATGVPLYRSIGHLDGRPTEVLVDNLGDPEDLLKFQTGDPVAKPWPFIGALGEVR